MAKKGKEKPENAAEEKAPAKKKGGVKGFFLFMVLGLAALFMLPITLVMLCGLLPSFSALLTDRSKGRNMLVAIGALNMTGVAHIIIGLIRKGVTLDYAMQILREPSNWLIMWGGAGVGYALFAIIPPIVAQVLAIMADVKAQKLKTNQGEIEKIWGKQVKE